MIKDLSTSRLVGKPIVESHATEMYELLRDPSLYQYVPEDPPLSVSELALKYSKLSSYKSPNGQEDWLNWILFCRSDQINPIGYVQATVAPTTGIASIAYLLNLGLGGNGYAREAVQAMVTFLREAYKINRVEANIDTRNRRSVNLVSKLGFHLERVIKNADYFKGSSSDEFVFVLDFER